MFSDITSKVMLKSSIETYRLGNQPAITGRVHSNCILASPTNQREEI